MPGTPSTNNAIPMPYFGTTTFAAPGLGIIASIITLAFGSTNLRPGAPAESRMEPIDAARPEQIVDTGLLTDNIVSYIANPAVTCPPGLLMISWISFPG